MSDKSVEQKAQTRRRRADETATNNDDMSSLIDRHCGVRGQPGTSGAGPRDHVTLQAYVFISLVEQCLHALQVIRESATHPVTELLL